mmetsp:Transcript_8221/g.10213  ORF Transcript_8221/g.10213 Transcript_8221/m.10213 type:complete len:300 (+) Transcript_8221:2-901(+)
MIQKYSSLIDPFFFVRKMNPIKMSNLQRLEQQKESLTTKYQETISALETEYKELRRKAQEKYILQMESLHHNNNSNAIKTIKEEIFSDDILSITHIKTVYKCTECDKTYKSLGGLKIHQRLHDGRHVTCGICNKKFAKQYTLDAHMGTHDPKFICDYKGCNKKCPTKSALKRHKIIHTDKAFKCFYCDKKFDRKSAQLNHQKIHLNMDKPFKCNECGSHFKFKKSLTKHILSKHTSDDKKPYHCHYNNCGKPFISLIELTNHFLIHENIKPFSCHICGLRAANKSGIDAHIESIHNNPS